MITVASPGYLLSHPRPTLSSLADHALIALVPTGGRAIWPVLRAALVGVGLCHLPAFSVRGDLASGDLVQVLSRHAVDVGGVFAIALPSALARAFVETALSHFSAL